MEEYQYVLFYRDGELQSITKYNKSLEECKKAVEDYNANNDKQHYEIVSNKREKEICEFKISERQEYKDNVQSFKYKLDELGIELRGLSHEISHLAPREEK